MSTTSTTTERIIYLALELSRSTWLAALRRPGAEKTVLHRLDGGDTSNRPGCLHCLGVSTVR